MKLDRKLLEERKDIECQLRTKLIEMKPKVKFPAKLPCKFLNFLILTGFLLVVNRGDKYEQKYGEKSNEVAN